ncbi:phage baseplate protein [Streptomyces sp. NPDC004290]
MRITDENGIDLSGATGRLLHTVDLVKGPAPQAIASDTRNGWIYVLQMESGSQENIEQGNMRLNRIDRATNKVLDSMQLKRFGHGISVGVEPGDGHTYLWTEVGPEMAYSRDGNGRIKAAFGKAVTRFRYAKDTVLDAADPALRKFTPPGSTAGTGPSIDPVNNLLYVMHHKKGRRTFTRYDLAAAAAGTWTEKGTFVIKRCEDLVPPQQDCVDPEATPDVPSRHPLKTELTSQGYTVLGNVLYWYQWAPYFVDEDPETPPEDGYPGIAFLTSYDWTEGQRPDRTGLIDRKVVTTAGGLTRREPEGAAVEVDPATGEPRLLIGFSNTVPTTTDSRDVTVCWYPTRPAVDGVRVLADWEDLALETIVQAGPQRPRGRLISYAGTTYLQLRGTLTAAPGLTQDTKIGTLPHRLRPTAPTRAGVPRNNHAGRCVCRVETNVSGDLWVYGAYSDNAITWIDLDGVSVVWQ